MRFEAPRGILTLLVLVLVLSVSGLVDAATTEDGVADRRLEVDEAGEQGFVDIGGNTHEENIRFIVDRG